MTGFESLTFLHLFLLFVFHLFLPPSGVLKVRGSDWGPSPLLLMTLTDSA